MVNKKNERWTIKKHVLLKNLYLGLNQVLGESVFYFTDFQSSAVFDINVFLNHNLQIP